MPLPSFSLRRYASFMPWAGILLVVVMMAVTAWSIVSGRELARRDAEQAEANITFTLDRAIECAVTTLDLSLRAAVQGMSTPGIATLDPTIRKAVLFDGRLTTEGLSGILVADEHGDTLFTSPRDAPEPVNVADLDYFQAQRASAGDMLIVSGPVRARSDGRWVLVFSRRLSRPDGSFAGVVAGGIQLSLFNSLFDTLELDPDAIVTLMTLEGVSVARRPSGETFIGRDLRNGAIHTHVVQNGRGTFEGVTLVDGSRRLFTYRRVGDLPLVVAMGLTTERVYGPWRQRAWLTGGVVLLIGGLYLLAAKTLRSELRQRARAERAALMAQAEAEDLTRELSQSLARREALVATTTDAMIVAKIHGDGQFAYEEVNPVWERMTGRSAADAIGRDPLACFPQPIGDTVLRGWEECVQTRRPIRFSFTNTIQGREHAWDSVVCPVIEADGSIRRIIGTTRDVTEQRSLERKLRQTLRLEAVGQLTSGIAHDFNNLLQSMLGALEVANDGPFLDGDRREALQIAIEAANRGAGLVHQLLAFSRKQMLSPTPLEPERVLARIVPLLRSSLGSNHRLVTEIQPGIGQVLADELQLGRCIMNMVLNARDATLEGGTLRLLVCEAEPGQAEAAMLDAGDYVRFVVEDEGTGITADSLPRVFEPFFTTKDVGKGNGLGLSMVQGFARQSGGDATIESAVGVGTAASLWLPRIAAAPHVAKQPVMEVRTGERSGRRRVLVVDDERSVLQTLSLFLRNAGYWAVAAGSGEAALARFDSDGPFDLVITDQSMPGITGTELLETLLAGYPSLPAMVITGFDRVTGLERLANRVTVLNKPFQRAVFLRHVAALLEANQPAEVSALELTT